MLYVFIYLRHQAVTLHVFSRQTPRALGEGSVIASCRKPDSKASEYCDSVTVPLPIQTWTNLIAIFMILLPSSYLRISLG